MPFARLGAALAVLLSVFVWSETAHAYAWMIRHGYGGCVTCHADPSGGELLTAYGRIQGDLLLRMRYGKDSVSGAASSGGSESSESFDEFDDFDTGAGGSKGKEAGDDEVRKSKAGPVEDLDAADDAAAAKDAPKPKPESETVAAESSTSAGSSAGFLWGLIDLPTSLLLGGSYRHVALLKGGQFRNFPMQADLYGQLSFGSLRVNGSIGAARVPVGSPHARAAQVTTDQGEGFNLISRTHWVGYDFGQGKSMTMRAGRINLPFGVRVPEHVLWVREASRTDRESDQQHGVALSYNGAQFRGEVMGIAGNFQLSPDRYRERGYSLYVETLVTEPFATGVSSLFTVAEADVATLEEESTTRGAHGVFVRFKASETTTVMVEMDALHKSRSELGYVGFVQLDFEPVQGLHLGSTGEVLDRGYRPGESNVPGIDTPRIEGFGKPRFGGWFTVDWFFLPQLELRLDAIVRQDDPFTVMGQLHAYL